MQQGQGNAARTALNECTFKNRISRQIAVRKLQSLALLLRLQGRQCGIWLSMPGTGRFMAWL